MHPCWIKIWISFIKKNPFFMVLYMVGWHLSLFSLLKQIRTGPAYENTALDLISPFPWLNHAGTYLSLLAACHARNKGFQLFFYAPSSLIAPSVSLSPASVEKDQSCVRRSPPSEQPNAVLLHLYSLMILRRIIHIMWYHKSQCLGWESHS